MGCRAMRHRQFLKFGANLYGLPDTSVKEPYIGKTEWEVEKECERFVRGAGSDPVDVYLKDNAQNRIWQQLD